MKKFKLIFMSMIGLLVSIAQAEDNIESKNSVNKVSVTDELMIRIPKPVLFPVIKDGKIYTIIPGITEKNGVVSYYKDPIYDLHSNDAHAAYVRGNLSEQEHNDLIVKNGGAACSDETLRKAYLKIWDKEHKTTLTNYEKMIGVTLFTAVVGCVVAYQYLYPPKEDKNSTEK